MFPGRRKQCGASQAPYPPYNNGEKKSDHREEAEDSTESTTTDYALFDDLPSWLEDFSSDSFVPPPMGAAARGKHTKDDGDEDTPHCQRLCAGSFFLRSSPPPAPTTTTTLAPISETAAASPSYNNSAAPKLTAGCTLQKDISDYDMFCSAKGWEDVKVDEGDNTETAEEKRSQRNMIKKKKTQIFGALKRRYLQRRTKTATTRASSSTST